MITKQIIRTTFYLAMGSLLLLAPVASGQSCEPELTAVFLVGGIYPGTALSLDLLHISQVGVATYPSPEELLQIVADYYAGDPFFSIYNQQPGAIVGNFQLFVAQPMDFGTVTIVDIRDGTIVFASARVWMGYGQTAHPTASTHDWTWEAGVPATDPSGVAILPNYYWADEGFGSQEFITQVTLDHIRQTDVCRSFGSCSPYLVTGYIHTPTVGATDPSVALEVLIVSGHAAPPWGPEPIDTTPTSLGMVKAVYRGPDLE